MEEETSEWRYFRTLNLPFDKAHAEKDGLRFDLEEVNMEETISSAVTQALEEVGEKILKKARTTDYADRTDYDDAYDIIQKYAKSKGLLSNNK
jgi:hypothetical protein